MRSITPCSRPDTGSEQSRSELADLLDLARQPWTTRIGPKPVLVRPSTPWDLVAVARMHGRCSPRTLLDGYRLGGRPPAVLTLDRELRNAFSFVAIARDGSVIATACFERDRGHPAYCAEVRVLVEDAWQRKGLGGELAAHLAGAAQVAGFTEVIAYPATALRAAQRLMPEIGRTRIVPHGGDVHLHTYLSEGATLGLGSVRERLAG
jgi:GNAT superfamily N-acetyltransferase